MKPAILMITGLLGLTAPGAAHAADPADVAALQQLKLELWPRAYARPDPALLDRLLAAEFQMIDADGAVSTKADELAFLRRKPGDPADQRFRYEIDRLEVFENGTAIVSGTGHVDAPAAGGGRSVFSYRSSNVLIKRAGTWQAIASHVSGVKPKTE